MNDANNIKKITILQSFKPSPLQVVIFLQFGRCVQVWYFKLPYCKAANFTQLLLRPFHLNWPWGVQIDSKLHTTHSSRHLPMPQLACNTHSTPPIQADASPCPSLQHPLRTTHSSQHLPMPQLTTPWSGVLQAEAW